MATTRISDVIVPEVYNSYEAINSPEKSIFVTSGVIVANSGLDAIANQGGETINIPFWKDLDSSVEENLGSDDPALIASAQKISTAKMVARVVGINQIYSNANLTSQLAGSDANQQVKNRFGTYWERRFQKKIIAVTNGIMADNVANNIGDMVEDIASEDGANATAINKWSRDAFTDAVFTMGDNADTITAIAVHSAILQQMVKADDIDYIPDSNGSLTIPTFMGKRVIVDDGMTVTAGTTSGLKYTTVLFGQGALSYGQGTHKKPMAIWEIEDAGNGDGIENIVERKIWLIHPFGYQTVGTPTAKGGFSNAELASAGTWTRVVDRKSVPLAFLITN